MQTNPESRTQHAIHGLYAIADTGILASQDLLACVKQSILGGATMVQLRDKSVDESRRRETALLLKKLCAEHNVCFIINDDVKLAAAIQADGVHLGKDDMPVSEARALVGDQSIIGASCYNRLSLAEDAQEQGADYVAFGSFYNSNTKPEAVSASLALVTEAVARINIPIVAIGGIKPDNAAPLIRAGISAIAAASGIFKQDDIRAAAAAYYKLF